MSVIGSRVYVRYNRSAVGVIEFLSLDFIDYLMIRQFIFKCITISIFFCPILYHLFISDLIFFKFIFRMESLWVQTAISAIRVIAFVCDVITFPVYLVLQQPWKRRQLSKRIKVSISCRRFSFLSSLHAYNDNLLKIVHWMLLIKF